MGASDDAVAKPPSEPPPSQDLAPLFVGKYVHSIDEKRRVAIPKAVREELDRCRLGSAFYLVRGPGDPCIWLFPERSFATFVKTSIEPMTAKQFGIGSKETRDFVRRFLASAVRTDPDKQGRIVLPEDLCALAKIQDKGDVAFMGVANKVEIWSPAVLRERDDDQEFNRRALELFG
jgi:MraZ protein